MQQANKLRGMQSSPSPISKEEPKQYVDDSLRQFDSPEAVKEFLLHAYRPASLSTAVPMDGADGDTLYPEQGHIARNLNESQQTAL